MAEFEYPVMGRPFLSAGWNIRVWHALGNRWCLQSSKVQLSFRLQETNSRVVVNRSSFMVALRLVTPMGLLWSSGISVFLGVVPEQASVPGRVNGALLQSLLRSR